MIRKSHLGIFIGAMLFVWLNMPKIDLADGTPIPQWLFPPRIIILHLISTVNPILVPIFETLLVLLFGIWIYFGIRIVHKDDVLKHPKRVIVFSMVKENPGLSFSDLVRKTGMNRGTLSYHISKLLWSGKLIYRGVGGTRRYFENHGQYGNHEQCLFPHIRNKVENAILILVCSKPGIGREELALRIGLTGPAITWHMNRLRRDEIIIKIKNGRKAEFFINPEIKPFLHELCPTFHIQP